MIRLRIDLQHGPVQGDAQLIADMQRQYQDLKEGLEHRRAERSRSRELIKRRSQYELNRLTRGQAPPKAATAKEVVGKPGAAANRPVTPPKSPSPVRPVTPPKTPPHSTIDGVLYILKLNASTIGSLMPKQPTYPPPKVSGPSVPLMPKQPIIRRQRCPVLRRLCP